MYNSNPKLAIFLGFAKGLVKSHLVKRSKEELISDITIVSNMFNMCMEGEIVSDNAGHKP